MGTKQQDLKKLLQLKKQELCDLNKEKYIELIKFTKKYVEFSDMNN